ncbi:MAG: helix-turn-helix domain-containing protein [Oscillospiraceae bacterium]|nr:helix-turn-helix domain-containing protein [Oscillospiraceae bacterium]
MECKDVLVQLRESAGQSQQELADRLFVTRQAVSRWERGEAVPSSDLLKQLSALFNVSINTLLGSPRQLICQSCGMPLTDGIMGHDRDGAINQDYCKWCYEGGAYLRDCTVEEMVDFCTDIMAREQGADPEKVRPYLQDLLPKLGRWKKG